MKLAILFPGYLDSPNYLHLKTFSKSCCRVVESNKHLYLNFLNNK